MEYSRVFKVMEEALDWGTGTRLAIASRTDEPDWAREILGKFKSSKGRHLMDLMDPNLVEM
jgi:hypothetical protein